jgi:alpha-L-rhamnosidase
VNKPVRRASLYICGLGYYELYLNEKRVGDHVLDPGWTDNNSRVLYVTYDVTEQLSKGGNAIGIMLGRGFPGSLVNDTWEFYKHSHQPRMRMLLNIEYTDGTRTDIISEPGWKVTGGPVVFDCPYRGEVIDARRERFGWNKAGFNASSWDSAVSSPAPAGEMTAQAIDPIRTKEEIRPQSVTNPKPGVYVFDFGKNISGWVRLKTSGPSGTEILVRYSEKNDPDVPLPTPGSFHFSYQQHGFILKGKGVETLEPKFSYTGFRYSIVSGAVESLDADSLTAVHVHTDVDTEGNFQCSNPLLNKIHRATRLTLLNNMQSIPHDCPTREKHGWGDIWTSEAAIYNFETAAFYEKWLDDWYDIESHNGKGGWLYYYAPHPKGRTGSVAPCWWATSINIPWTLYVYYGDRQILANHYVAMKRVINAMASARVAKDDAYIIKGKFGDWASPGGSKPKEGVNIYGNACYFHCVDTLSKIADVLEKKEDAIRYRKLAADIKRAFNRKFYDSEMNCYRGENRQIKEYRQSADAVPLYMGLVPVEKHQSIIGNLLENLSQRKERLNTGYLGTKALMEVLPAYGQGETTYRVASQTAFPGWGYFINNLNTTTIPEKWTAGNSQNHLSYVSVGAYYYRWLGGLQPYPEKPGFRHFFLRPTFVKDLDFVRVKYQSPSGLIRSSWTRGDGTLKWEIVIPPNTTASVIIPASVEKITESNSPAEQAKGVKLIKDEKENEKTSEFLVGSGFYNFEFVDNR